MKGQQAVTRAKSVRTLAESCTRSAWSTEALTCYLAATKAAEIENCDLLVPPAKPSANHPG